ncbi:MalY/PatB family protein [Enterococcus gallinarum]|uniref:MalY/PatB family protein n=1 Tax=Enterococcus gallinarum TaxID=1353 RepID=UPI003D6B321F
MRSEEFVERYSVDRYHTDSLKWDSLESKFGDKELISMWIADMEFQVPEQVKEKMLERIQHGVFGYSNVPESYYDAYSKWMEERYQFPLKKEWIRFSTGCVTSIAWMIHAFTQPKDHCLILTPVYYPFFNVVTNNDRQLTVVDLTYQDGYFTMDYEAIEKAIIEDDVKLFVQCSPQNPTGRVWTEEELEKVLAICKKHDVIVVSDEIHQDFLIGDHPFVPASAVGNGHYNDIIVMLSSASKTFNLAGLLHAHIIIPDDHLRAKFDSFASGLNRTEMNIMGLVATEAAYTYGADWLTGLIETIKENYEYLRETLHHHYPDMTVCSLEGTYLVLIDMRSYVSPECLPNFIQNRCHLAVDYGDVFGEITNGFIRLNLATDPKYVKQAVANIIHGISDL